MSRDLKLDALWRAIFLDYHDHEKCLQSEMNYNPANLPAIRREIEFMPDRTILWTKWPDGVWTFRYLA